MPLAPDLCFQQGRIVLLDGATGTELERRGFALDAPGWSARALVDSPRLLAQIHRDYAVAGAEIVTANTFRLHRRNLATWGHDQEAERLVNQAVELVRESLPPSVLVAGSVAPLMDCYAPDAVPPEVDLEREHRELARHLKMAGADVILIETMIAVREARAAARAAAGTGLPVIISFHCGPEARLLSGETLGDAVAAVRPTGPTAIGVNCLSAGHVPAALEVLRSTCQAIPFGVAANTGARAADGSWHITTAVEPAVYAVMAKSWQQQGACWIGGCCGTTPAHIEALKAIFS